MTTTTKPPAPQPFDYPPCADCGHIFGVHLAVGKETTEKHRGPCSSAHGPTGTACGCRQFRAPAVAS